MKRFQNILMAVAASVLAVVSCAKEEVAPESNVQEDKVYEYLFTLGEADDTKATLEEGNVVTWQAGDYLGVVCKHGTSYSWANNNTKSAIIPSTDDTPAVLNVTSHYALEGGDGVYCFFPYKDGSEFKTASITFSIPTEQNNSINEMPMASIPYTVSGTISEDTPTPVGSIDMMMLGSIARFKIYSSVEEYRSETVQSVTLTTDQPIAGSFTKDISVINPKTASTLTISGYEEKGITETGITGTIGENSETAIIADVVVAPGTYTGKVIVRTDKASYEYSLGTGKTFERAHAKPLALNLGKEGARSEQKYFRKVTTDHDNFSGTYLVVYSDDKISKAFSGYDSGGNCIDVTIANDAIASTDALLSEALTIVKENDKYYLKNAAGKYLYMSTASTSSIGSSDDKKEVTVSYSSNIEVSSTNGSTGTLQCKTGTIPYIRFYTSSQKSVDFYVLDGTEIPNDPNLVSLAVSDVNVPSTTKNVEVEIQCNKDWKATATSDLLTDGGISIEGTSTTTSFIVPFNEANTDVKNDKVVTVTVSAGEGKYYVEKTIKVTQNAPQPKLELESKTGSATKDAGSTTFNVTGANFEWSVLGITVDGNTPEAGYSATKNTGEGYLGNVTVSYPENTTDKPKQIVVTIGDSEVKTATYTLTQAAGQTASVLYELVTNVNNLAAGDVILLGCSSKGKAAGAFGSSSFFNSVVGTFSNGTLSSDDAIEITLGKSGDNWTLTTSEGTIGTSVAKSLKKDGTGTTTWTISISSEGTATIKSTTTTYGWIQYNASSPRFLNYASDQTAIQIYKKADSRTSQTISYSKETGSIDLYTDEKNLPTLITTGLKTSISSYESSDTDVATIDGDGVITAVAIGTTTIKAKAAGNDTYKPAEATFELTVSNSAPVIKILKSTENISSNAGTDLTIASAYSLSNVEDSGITVSYSGNITKASILNGTVTYSISENTSTESPTNSTITLKVTNDDSISGTITVTQAKKGGSVAPPVGTVLWSDDFGDEGNGQTDITKGLKLSDYGYSGREGYKDNQSITLTASAAANVAVSTTSSSGVTSGHLWLKKQSQATVSTSAIKVYGANTVTLSFTKAKGSVKVGYSFDGTNWSEFNADTTNATSFSHDITTTAKDVVYIRFKEGNNSNALRIDDFTLTIKD